jgi:hypothetical protein
VTMLALVSQLFHLWQIQTIAHILPQLVLDTTIQQRGANIGGVTTKV